MFFPVILGSYQSSITGKNKKIKNEEQSLCNVKPSGASFTKLGPPLSFTLQGPYSSKAGPKGFTLHIGPSYLGKGEVGGFRG